MIHFKVWVVSVMELCMYMCVLILIVFLVKFELMELVIILRSLRPSDIMALRKMWETSVGDVDSSCCGCCRPLSL